MSEGAIVAGGWRSRHDSNMRPTVSLWYLRLSASPSVAGLLGGQSMERYIDNENNAGSGSSWKMSVTKKSGTQFDSCWPRKKPKTCPLAAIARTQKQQ